MVPVHILRVLFASAILVITSVAPAIAGWELKGFTDIRDDDGSGVRLATMVVTNPEHLDEKDEIQPVEMRFFIAEGKRYGIKVISLSVETQTFYEYESCDGPIALSGGFNVKLDSDGSRLKDQTATVDSAGNKPRRVAEGWVIVDGKELTPREPYTSGGAIADDGQKTWIVRLAEFDDLPPPRMLVQAKPIVIEHGEIGTTDGRTSMFRAVIGTSKQGDLFGAVLKDYSMQGTSLFDLAQLLTMLDAAIPNFKLDDVLAMDGGPSGHMFVRGDTRPHFGYPADAFLPNFLCVSSR